MMAADCLDGRPDNRDRGLIMLAWHKGRPVACVSRGEYVGMTAPEVAAIVDCSVEYARACLLDGIIPTSPDKGGRRLSEEAMARRRRAGIPEHLVRKPAHVIARELGMSEAKVTAAIYRNGRIDE